MRKMAGDGGNGRVNNVDKSLRLLLDRGGPAYVLYDSVTQDPTVRRARNLYYTKGFAEVLLRELLMEGVKVKAPISRMLFRMTENGSDMTDLLPTHVRHWLPIIEDRRSAAVRVYAWARVQQETNSL